MKLKEFLNEKDIVGADEIYSKGELRLKKWGINKFKKLEDGTYEVWGDEDEEYRKKFPVKIKIFHGNINFSSKDLKSLKGSPEIVDGNFTCSWNIYLQSLEGGPRIVKRNFNCSENENLETLEGGPEIVNGNYFCNECNLKSLKGAPKIVGRGFFCFSNKNLKSLDGCPKIVKDDFDCRDIGIKPTKEYIKSLCNVGGEIFL